MNKMLTDAVKGIFVDKETNDRIVVNMNFDEVAVSEDICVTLVSPYLIDGLKKDSTYDVSVFFQGVHATDDFNMADTLQTRVDFNNYVLSNMSYVVKDGKTKATYMFIKVLGNM